MKADKINFGQTYIRPSLLRYMEPENQNKMPYIFGLGEFYPVDIFLGSNIKGQLTLDIAHSTAAKQLFFIDEIPKTFENIAALNLIHNMELMQRQRNGNIAPIMKTVIPDFDKMSIKELQLAVNDKIKYYYETLGKKFLQ